MKNAVSWYHVDTAGFATAVENLVGSKYWVLLNRRRDLKQGTLTGDLSCIDCYGPDWDPIESKHDEYEHEGIVLRAGMVL